MFPEYVATLQRRGLRLDSIIDYVKAGKESYRIVAAFDQFEYRHVAPLFRRLAEHFEYCVHGLNGSGVVVGPQPVPGSSNNSGWRSPQR
jgi:hypothetical protein